MRTCGLGCVTVSCRPRAPARVAGHGAPERKDTNGTNPAITTASVRLAEATHLRDGRQAQTAERKDSTMRDDMLQRGRDAIVEAVVETVFDKLKTKTA